MLQCNVFVNDTIVITNVLCMPAHVQDQSVHQGRICVLLGFSRRVFPSRCLFFFAAISVPRSEHRRSPCCCYAEFKPKYSTSGTSPEPDNTETMLLANSSNQPRLFSPAHCTMYCTEPFFWVQGMGLALSQWLVRGDGVGGIAANSTDNNIIGIVFRYRAVTNHVYQGGIRDEEEGGTVSGPC
ncbi:hypothetical protein BD289DRAFT_430154 [Coniella lustricola]|uniref:Uncharacterized protein n=1 Tax=Coniella lustricola TaxID=2025994 RepID=A0A2T3ACG9_9PEZI|nr:hypothetical protein BD289DRAFT_430154 [Coniella lustricola]